MLLHLAAATWPDVSIGNVREKSTDGAGRAYLLGEGWISNHNSLACVVSLPVDGAKGL